MVDLVSDFTNACTSSRAYRAARTIGIGPAMRGCFTLHIKMHTVHRAVHICFICFYGFQQHSLSTMPRSRLKHGQSVFCTLLSDATSNSNNYFVRVAKYLSKLAKLEAHHRYFEERCLTFSHYHSRHSNTFCRALSLSSLKS